MTCRPKSAHDGAFRFAEPTARDARASRWRDALVAGAAGFALLLGCGDDDDPPAAADASADAASMDSGTRDSGRDAGRDSGRDALDGGPEAGSDLGPPDTGPLDSGTEADAAPGGEDGGGPVIECPRGCGAGETCCPVGIVGTCVPTPESGACPLPDLTVSTETLSSSVYVSWEHFAADDCAIVEGCITTPGWRRLLRFSTETPNIGTGDMTLGAPDDTNPHFEYSPCHMHYHFDGYADYRLVGADGAEVGRGHKQAFCLLDSSRWVTDDPTVARTQRYTCDDQGIQRGWSDVYDSSLDCQWIDVTDVPPGDYSLRVRINYERVLPELSYDNNQTQVTVTVPPDVAADPLAPCDLRLEGPSRDCGWSVLASDGATRNTFDCAAGSMVTVGCGSTDCASASCGGDPVMRVCAGAMACESRTSLAQDDDCGRRNYCPSTTVTCPESGQITVLVAPYTAGDAYSCDVVTM